jgi:hypothetical protein
MSDVEKNTVPIEKSSYSSPEIVCLGEVIELTGDGPGVVADGHFPPNPPNTFKEV